MLYQSILISLQFTIDISKFEFTEGKRPRDIEGAVVFIYSPEMLAIEKLRALCQQLPSYKDIVLSMTLNQELETFTIFIISINRFL